MQCNQRSPSRRGPANLSLRAGLTEGPHPKLIRINTSSRDFFIAVHRMNELPKKKDKDRDLITYICH